MSSSVSFIPSSEENTSGNTQFSLSTDSNGKQLSEQQSEYFKDSKVKDDNGALLVVYHGTDKEFTTFNSGEKRTTWKLNFGEGFYFTPSKSMAENYTENGRIMSVYVNVTNPYEIFGTWLDKMALERMSAEFNEEVTIDNVSEVLQKHGYDGIVARNYNGSTNPIGQVMVYSGNQIKSVDNQTPTNNPDIVERCTIFGGSFNK